MVSGHTNVPVRLRNDRWQREHVDEFTEVDVDEELADLFAWARCWAADMVRADHGDLTFSAMLAAMVAADQPLARWLRGYFDRLAVPFGDITRHRSYDHPPLYANDPAADQHLMTTISFRTALSLAGELRDDIAPGDVSPRPPLAARHFMAAYAVCPDYHLPDFRRYRIDRREWGLSLSEELARRYPAEADGWIRYADRAPKLLPMAFANDTPDGSDRLHLEREVSAFARLIASRSTATPLSIGVFGAWGSGKSFFMRRTRARVDQLATAAAAAPLDSDHHSRIAQIEFNAWHYSDGNLIASLVDHVLRNLRIGGEDEDEAAVQRRAAEIVALIGDAETGLATAERTETAATARVASAMDDLRRAQRGLPEQVREASLALSDAEVAQQAVRDRLHRAEHARDVDTRRAETLATGEVLLDEVAGEAASRAVHETADALVGLVGRGRELRAKRRQLVVGAALVVAGAATTALLTTDAWGRLVAALTAIGTIAAAAIAVLRFLGQLAERGERFEGARAEATRAAATRVASEHEPNLESLRDELRVAERATLAAHDQLEQTAHATSATEALDARRAELEVARRQRAAAQRDIDALHAELDATSIDQRLADYIDGHIADSGYHQRLGIHSQVRTDFERLSRLMRLATADHFENGAPPPTVGRIVLYIDDLDRCPEQVVLAVLRAVHLLLAFDLFVCVVAVDPRWLTACLQSAPGVTSGQHDAGGASDLDDQVGRSADPADYIEKIFQVPIWLRPVASSLRPALVRSWLDEPEPTTGTATAAPAIGALTPAELAFLDGLAPFLPGKPRTLKRFANTYRLVRTSLSDVQFKTFTLDGTSVAPYRICLAQLAVLSADRDRALRMITSLDASGARTFGDWLTELETSDPELTALLRTALGEQLDLAEFRHWLERTRRYSFYL